MDNQNYSNHSRMVPLYHYVLSSLLLAAFIGSLVNLFQSLDNHANLYSASLITAISLSGILLFWFCRSFALRAQDRAIRAEENLRHFAMTGKLLDSKLRMSQIIALRFAGDEEFVVLAKKAAAENMGSKQIKEAIKQWKGDYNRV
jgi:Family of unknown function (DUF6526)